MRILIIDDSPADRELAIRALDREFAGAEFIEIGRKGEFVGVLDGAPFDAVLSDFRLHWTDGLRILKEIKQRYPYVPVILLTESGSEEIAVEGMKAGLSDYVLKHHLQRLAIAVRESLEKSRLRQGYDQALAQLRQAHAELGEAAEGLERRVAERTAELARANEDLRQEMAERRRVEEERERLLAENLRQRELLEHLIESAPVGIAVVRGADHAYEFANPTYRDVLGIEEAESIVGRPFAAVSPDLSGLVPELLQAAGVSGQAVGLREYERTSGKEGESLSYWDLDAVPLHDAQGVVAEVLVLLNDVTQKVLARVQAEDLAIQLAGERRFLSNIMDSVPVGINYVDQDLIFRQCNRAAAHELGRPVGEIIGHHLHEIAPGARQLWDAVEGVLRTGARSPMTTMSMRWQHRPEAGERHFMVAFLPDKDESGRVRGVFSEGQDITELVEMRRELERSKEGLERRVQERTAALGAVNDTLSQQAQRLRILHQIDRSILAVQTPLEIAEAATRSLVEATAALCAGVELFDLRAGQREVLAGYGPGVDQAGARQPLDGYWLLRENLQGRTGMIEDLAGLLAEDEMKARVLAAGIRCYAGVPLFIAGEAIGAIILGHAQPGPLSEDILEFARQVADQLALAIHNARLFAEVQRGRQQLRSLSHHLVTLQEAQQKSLSRELHDRSGQSLTALKLGLGLLRREAGDSPGIQARVDELRQKADQAAVELHDLAVGLRPSALDRYGLVAALEQLTGSFRNQNQVDVQLVVTGLDDERLPDDIETALYRVMQEGLTNIARHANATHVGVVLAREQDSVSLILEDDGRGFDVNEALRRGRLGLLGMRERAEMLGGTMTIESTAGGGSTLFVEVPLRPGEMSEDRQADTFAQAAEQAASLPAAGREPIAGMPELPEREGAGPQRALEIARAKALGDALVDITYSLARTSDVDEILGLALARAVEATGCETGVIEKREGAGWVVSHVYRLPDEGIGQRFTEDDSPATMLAEQTRQPVVIDDTAATTFPGAERLSYYGIRSLAAIPLVAGDRLVGVLNLMQNTAAVPFQPAQVEFLGRLATLVALALENAQLHEAEAQQHMLLEAVFAAAPVGLAVVVGSDCQIMLANDAYRALTPHPQVEPVGRLYREIWPPEEGFDRGEGWLAGVIETGEPLHVARHMRAFPDGSERYFGFHVRRFSWNGRPAALVALVDTTATEQSAATAHQLAAELDAVLSSIADGLVVYDREGRIVRLNAVAEEVLGYSPETRELSIAERSASVLRPLKPDGSPFDPEEYPAVRAVRGEVVRNQEMILHVPARAGGKLRVTVSSAPIRMQDGRVTGCVTTFTSTEACAEVSEQLNRADEQLRTQADALAEREAELRAVARHQTELQERGFAWVAHQLYNEIGQQLAALKVQLGVAGQEIARGAPSAARLAEVKDTVDRVLRDLHSLATLLRPVTLDRLGLAAAIEQYLGEFGKQHNVSVQFAAVGMEPGLASGRSGWHAGEGLRLPAEVETAIYRIVQTALENVARHAEASHVDIVISRVGPRLAVTVEDDGIGFDPEEATRRAALGLVSMRERAEGLGGSFTVESQPGAGTTVIVEVPLENAAVDSYP